MLTLLLRYYVDLFFFLLVILTIMIGGERGRFSEEITKQIFSEFAKKFGKYRDALPALCGKRRKLRHNRKLSQSDERCWNFAR